jgi:hypothetical protein
VEAREKGMGPAKWTPHRLVPALYRWAEWLNQGSSGQ